MTLESLDILVPDGRPVNQALARTTHMAIAAHPDDIEIIAHHGIAACYQHPRQWFCGVVVTDGAGSPRAGRYAAHSDEAMAAVRRDEQIAAARLGEYGAVVQLALPSGAVKRGLNATLVGLLQSLLSQARPHTLYLHNFADRHQTHVSCCAQALAALRRLSLEQRPAEVYGVEVWRDLDWLPATYKKALDVSRHPELRSQLIGVFASQVDGGKRYDLAVDARSRAHATFSESHQVDAGDAVTYALDLAPLVRDEKLTLQAYWRRILQEFDREVRGCLAPF